jgi:hypothetical protein
MHKPIAHTAMTSRMFMIYRKWRDGGRKAGAGGGECLTSYRTYMAFLRSDRVWVTNTSNTTRYGIMCPYTRDLGGLVNKGPMVQVGARAAEAAVEGLGDGDDIVDQLFPTIQNILGAGNHGVDRLPEKTLREKTTFGCAGNVSLIVVVRALLADGASRGVLVDGVEGDNRRGGLCRGVRVQTGKGSEGGVAKGGERVHSASRHTITPPPAPTAGRGASVLQPYVVGTRVQQFYVS